MKKDSGIAFVEWCLGTTPGYAAIGSKHHRTKSWKLTILPYPSSVKAMTEHVSHAGRASDMYFCPTVLRAPRSIKENIILSTVIWADLDECPPDAMLIKPTVVVETSPHRYQAFWKLRAPEQAVDAEEINHRIAKYHDDQGCDQAGWDLTQQLRIPGTNNYKYGDRYSTSIIVKIIESDFERKYDLSDFDVYPAIATRIKKPIPEVTRTASEILYDPHIQTRLHASAYELFEETPKADSWSESLWKLELLLVGAGLSDEEVFAVAKEAACNKYERDNRPESHLWEDVCRARAQKNFQAPSPSPRENGIGSDNVYISKKPILTEDEHTLIKQRKTIIEEYAGWASGITDAPKQYHEAGAFAILSGLLAGVVKIPTSAGTLRTNLWFMLLGETTLSRKTTSQKLAIGVLEDVDSECILATDGSVEGVLDAMASRRNRASIYHKDEFSGLLEAMVKRDYLAGAMEHFTQLYDSQHIKRLLRTGPIDIRDPIFILFTGGIRDRIYWNLSVEHIASGFAPRFIFVSPQVDLTNSMPLGPPGIEDMQKRAEIVTRLHGIYSHYNKGSSTLADGSIQFHTWDVKIDPDAWVVYNRIEHVMHTMAFESDVSDLMMPMMDRLAKSGLKMATLIAASERLGEEVVVHTIDILHAFHYIESYLDYSVEIVSNAGKSANEMLYDRLAKYVSDNPGVNRSLLMRRYHMSSKSADGIFTTLEERGVLVKIKMSDGWTYYPNDYAEIMTSTNGDSPHAEEEVDFSETSD